MRYPSAIMSRDQEPGNVAALRRLREMLASLRPGLATVSSARRYCLRSVSLDATGLLVVLSGKKILRLGSSTTRCSAGEYALVHHPECVDMEAIPDPDTGLFRAWILNADRQVIDIARLVLSHHPSDRSSEGERITAGSLATIEVPLLALVDLLASSRGSPDPAQRVLAIASVFVAVGRSGANGFLRHREASLSSRIRTLVDSSPSRDWQSNDFERDLHVSGATLRRKLKDEGTSLRELLREARLLHGLALLQTTHSPMKTVAFRSGYRSVSTFRRNLAARFGADAAALAQSQGPVEPRAVRRTAD